MSSASTATRALLDPATGVRDALHMRAHPCISGEADGSRQRAACAFRFTGLAAQAGECVVDQRCIESHISPEVLAGVGKRIVLDQPLVVSDTHRGRGVRQLQAVARSA